MPPVMTLGVAPGASEAMPEDMTDTEQTDLLKFAGHADHADQGGDYTRDTPTPAANAADINDLAACVETLTDQVTTLAERLEHQDTMENSAEDIDSTPRGMFQ